MVTTQVFNLKLKDRSWERNWPHRAIRPINTGAVSDSRLSQWPAVLGSCQAMRPSVVATKHSCHMATIARVLAKLYLKFHVMKHLKSFSHTTMKI